MKQLNDISLARVDGAGVRQALTSHSLAARANLGLVPFYFLFDYWLTFLDQFWFFK